MLLNQLFPYFLVTHGINNSEVNIVQGIFCFQIIAVLFELISDWCLIYHKCVAIFEGRKEGNVLFNIALNTFYLQLYGVGPMVKDHSDSERGNPLPPLRLLFPISTRGSFICTIP